MGIEELTALLFLEWLLVIIILAASAVGCYAHVKSIQLGTSWLWFMLAFALAGLITFPALQLILNSKATALTESIVTILVMAFFFAPIIISLSQYAFSFTKSSIKEPT